MVILTKCFLQCMKIKASWGPLKAWGPRGSIPCSPFPPWWACMLGTLMVNITPNMCSLHKECLHPFQRSEIWVRVSVGVKWYQQQFLMEQTHHLLHLQMGRVGLQNMSGHACRKKKRTCFWITCCLQNTLTAIVFPGCMKFTMAGYPLDKSS